MILTGPAIRAALACGDIEITPLQPDAIQPNGIDYHLDADLIRLDGTLDMRNPSAGQSITIPASGYVLEPGQLYLGLTQERVASGIYAQWLFGNRSIGNLGIFTQVCAPLGHVGSAIRWTLEIVVVRPVRVFAGMPFGKICFLVNQGDILPYGTSVFGAGKYTKDALTLSRLKEEHDKTD